MEIRGIIPHEIQKAADMAPSRKQEDAKLKDACQQFETLFLSQLFTQMRKSIPKTKLFGEGRDEEMMSSMLDQERAKVWAQTGGIGLANLLYQQMRTTIK
ncbi:MAG: rod-binding protein [Candidatus Eremiobacteraeota bacterium]|nr:rod-binding protein [Candidatus Eremiobacteraeota bacterium]